MDWADLATLDLSQFNRPSGKERLAKQLFDAIQNIGKLPLLFAITLESNKYARDIFLTDL